MNANRAMFYFLVQMKCAILNIKKLNHQLPQKQNRQNPDFRLKCV